MKTMQTNKYNHNKIILVITFVFLIFMIIILRLYNLSVVHYKPIVDSYNFNIDDIGQKRANIIDRNGFLLATDISTKTLYLNKELIKDEKFIANKLAKILNLNENSLYKKISDKKTKSKYILIKRYILPNEENKIRLLPIASLVFEDELLRYYPYNNLFSHVIGYVDIDKNGIIGLEKYYDSYLKEKNIPLKTTLDMRIQSALRSVIVESYKTFKPNFIVGIISEIKTGNILAIVSFPDFNPNINKPKNNTFNHATYGNYELGSVFKIFTMANGLELGLIKKDTIFDVSHDVNYGKFTAKDINSIKNRKKITTKEAFAISSNIVTVHIAKLIGIKEQLKFFDNLNLLEKIDIDLGETSLPLQPRKWKEINLMTIAYGYGVAVSPLHILNATNAIINDGNMITPRFSYEYKNQKCSNVISKNTSDIMKDFFKETVEKGTARLANVKGYDIGGKTGTARKIVGNDYKKGEHLASFIGVFPIYNPQYSIIIVADRPQSLTEKSDGTGSSVAAKIAHDVIIKITPFLYIY